MNHNHTAAATATATPKGNGTTAYSDYGTVPTTALGPATITIIVFLVLITCSILQCSRVRHTMRSRRMLARQPSATTSSTINVIDEDTSSWSPSTSTLQGIEAQQQQQQQLQHEKQQQYSSSLLAPPPPVMVQNHPSALVPNTAPLPPTPPSV